MTQLCRPPKKFRLMPYHWVWKPGPGDTRDRHPMVYAQDAWGDFTASMHFIAPEQAAKWGWRYDQPCIPPEAER